MHRQSGIVLNSIVPLIILYLKHIFYINTFSDQIKCLLWISIADRCLNEDYNNTVFLHNTMEDSNVQYSSDEKNFTAYKKFRNFNCSDRHVLTYGFLTLECQLGGQWNGTAPVCNGEGLAFSLINNLHNYKLYKYVVKGGGLEAILVFDEWSAVI